MKRLIMLIPVVVIATTGCTFVACDRVFPKLTWYWSSEAKRCRGEQVHPVDQSWTNGVVGEHQ